MRRHKKVREYSVGEEIGNSITHGVGAALAVAAIPISIVRAVGDDGRIGAQQLEPRFPARRGKSLAQRALRDAPPLFAQHVHRFDGERRVVELMLSEQMQRQVFFVLIVEPLPGERVGALLQRVKRRAAPHRAAFSA